MQKFVILALPRSRTAWLTQFLSTVACPVGHDVALFCDTVEQYTDEFARGMGGSVETGAQDAAGLLLDLGLKVVVIRRPEEEVAASLAVHGLDMGEELARRAAQLDLVSAQPGVRTIQFSDLRSPFCCKWLQEYCTGQVFDPQYWLNMNPLNIQIDMPARKEFLRTRAPAMVKLKEQVAGLSRELEPGDPELVVRPCSWSEIWPECNALGSAHYAEVEGELASFRPYLLNADLMSTMEAVGSLRLVGAWKSGRLVGYCSWLLQPDVESAGHLMASQGAWYAKPGTGAGVRLFRESLTLLRSAGIHNAFAHHRLAGRGKALGRLLSRFGGKPTQHTFMIPLAGA